MHDQQSYVNILFTNICRLKWSHKYFSFQILVLTVFTYIISKLQ